MYDYYATACVDANGRNDTHKHKQPAILHEPDDVGFIYCLSLLSVQHVTSLVWWLRSQRMSEKRKIHKTQK